MDAPRDLALATLVRTLRQLDAARRVLECLAAAGLRALPLKGAAVAEHLYDSPGERPMGDVDILALEDAERALAVLHAAGFSPLASADHAWALRDPASGTPVELHRALASPRGFHRLDPEALWSRRVAGTGIVPVRPCDEDLLVQLAVHGAFQHALRLRRTQWTDVALLVRRPLQAGRVAHAVEVARAGDALGATLAGAERVLGPGTIPPDLRERWATPGIRRWARRAAVIADDAPPRALALARWRLSRGRRAELLRLTLTAEGDEGTALGRAIHLGRRMFAGA